MNTFHERLKKVMTDKGITQSELCVRTGIPKSAMSQYLSGAFRPKQERSRLIAKAVGVSEDWLNGIDENSRVKATDEDIKFALWGGAEGITDEMFEEVKQFADMVRLREEAKRKAKK